MKTFLLLLAFLPDAGTPSRGLDPHNCGALQAISVLQGDLSAVAFSADGRLCAVGGTGNGVRVYDVATWRETREIRILGEAVHSMAFLPGGAWLVIGGDRTMRLVNAADGTEAGTFPHALGRARALAVSPDARELVSVHASGTTCFWTVEDRSKILEIPVSTLAAGTVAFARGGGRVAIVGPGGGVIRARKDGAWAEDGALDLEEDSASSAAFSRDDRFLLLGSDGGPVTVWNLEKGAAERALQGHQGQVRSVAVTADDRYAITAADDGAVRLWDWRKGAELAQLKHPGVRAIALHPSGRMFATAGFDRQLRVWGYVRGGAERPRTKGFCGISVQKSGGAVVVFSIVPGGPADQAGLKEGDAIRVIGTRAVKEPADALEALGSYGDGDEAVFEIERKGEEKQVRVRMGKKPGAKEKGP